MQVYLDNAATTPLNEQVIEEMCRVMREVYGNPSSVHQHGNKAKAVLDESRRKIAALIGCQPSEIYFTSGGTEADNTAIRATIRDYQLTHVVSSTLEHHAVLHTLEHLEKQGKITLQFVKLLPNGHIDLNDLELLLSQNPKTLVTLMHGNNEIGNLLNLNAVSQICQTYKAIFHCDTVQTMGHYTHDLSQTPVDFVVGAAHKFNGPKGVGFLFKRKSININGLIFGGSQERGIRSGTENLYGIVGMAKALELAYADMAEKSVYVEGLKHYMIGRLQTEIAGIRFNGDAQGESLYTVLSVSFPKLEGSDMLLGSLSLLHNISASGGSACSAGANVGSHVLRALNANDLPTIRFSFGKQNTKQEIDYVIDCLKMELDN